MKTLLISCSLHPQSRSFVLAKDLANSLQNLGSEATLIDLRELDLPICGLATARQSPDVGIIRREIENANAIIMTVPIYNFYANAAAKNVIELTGKAWENKIVGFACAAGGRSSYMSVMNLANSLMLDFRCLIVPRFVYATGDAFGNDRTPEMFVQSDEIRKRLRELAETTLNLARAITTI